LISAAILAESAACLFCWFFDVIVFHGGVVFCTTVMGLGLLGGFGWKLSEILVKDLMGIWEVFFHP